MDAELVPCSPTVDEDSKQEDYILQEGIEGAAGAAFEV